MWQRIATSLLKETLPEKKTTSKVKNMSLSTTFHFTFTFFKVGLEFRASELINTEEPMQWHLLGNCVMDSHWNVKNKVKRVV